jgi:hypothetical protein
MRYTFDFQLFLQQNQILALVSLYQFFSHQGMKRWLPSVSVNGLPLPAEPETENADQLKRRQASLPKRQVLALCFFPVCCQLFCWFYCWIFCLQFDSPIGDLFNGRLMSQVRCESCGFVSSKFDSFYDLSLGSVPTQHVEDLHFFFGF